MKAEKDREINVSELINLVYPVGSIYMSVNNTSPADLFGGIWIQITDTFLLSAGESYTAGNTGGSATVTLSASEIPSHTHKVKSVSSDGEHTHTRGDMNITGTFHHGSTGAQSTVADGAFYINTGTTYTGDDNNSKSTGYQTVFDAKRSWIGETSSNGAHTHTITIANTGSGQSHNNMPPYLVVYMWKRTG